MESMFYGSAHFYLAPRRATFLSINLKSHSSDLLMKVIFTVSHFSAVFSIINLVRTFKAPPPCAAPQFNAKLCRDVHFNFMGNAAYFFLIGKIFTSRVLDIIPPFC
jgi:hypothetical protein